MALLFSLLWKVLFYGVTIIYPAYKAQASVAENRVDRLWVIYFFIMGLLSMLQYTVLYPVVFLLDLVCDCLFNFFILLLAGWLYHEDYRGALLLEQLGAPYINLAYSAIQPIMGKPLGFVGVPNRESSKTN